MITQQNLSYTKIGDIIGMSASSVRKRWLKINKEFKKRM